MRADATISDLAGFLKEHSYRPWWRWINPYLYISRRDAAYETTLDIIQELSKEIQDLRMEIRQFRAEALDRDQRLNRKITS